VSTRQGVVPGAGLIRATACLLGAYWLLYALVTPVTVTDGQLYNQARLYVIRQEGLFSGWIPAHWMQLAFPWTFDAVHWPFLQLGIGVALPSFACLLGILTVVHVHVREHYGSDAAWRCVLALLTLPTLVYQGTSTKNDIAVVFAALAWWHAIQRWRTTARPIFLAASALAIAFAAGAKTSGLGLVPPMTLASLWWLRRSRWWLGAWLGGLLLAVLAVGSVETYAASNRAFGHPFGPQGLRFLGNRDGAAGAAANLIRHVLGNIDPGLDRLPPLAQRAAPRLEGICRRVLEATGLRGRGHAAGSSDARLDFTKSGHEAVDGFGPVGTLALLALPVLLLTRGPRSGPWLLAGGAVATLVLTSWTAGYGPWQNRFLLLPFVLATLALALGVDAPWRRHRALRIAGTLLLVYGAVAMPAFSFNRAPRDLWQAVTDRDRFMTREAPFLLPVLEAVREHRAACPEASWVVVPRPGTWELLWYQALGGTATILPRGRFNAWALQELQQRTEGPVLVLAIESNIPLGPPLVEVAAFPSATGADEPIRLLRWGDRPCDRNPP